MQTQWQKFLCELGAQLDQHHQIAFGDPREAIRSISNQNVLASLDHFGAIYVSGHDANTFLQSQFSNDINELDQHRVQFSAYCNPKGRMFAQFLVLPYRDGYLLLLPRELISKVLPRLKMFVLRSAVTLDDITEQIVCLGLIGNNISSRLSASWPILPANDYQLINSELNLLIKLPGPVARYLLICPLAAATAIWQELSALFVPSGCTSWHWCDIQSGLPSVWSQTSEEFVPQMLNLDLIGGVSFKKGCYPGQEIVARMHYLGKPKRRMLRLHSDTNELPRPGTDLFSAQGDGQSAGQVVIAEPAAEGGTDLLAVVQLAQFNEADLRLGDISGPVLTHLSLPYAVEVEI